MRKLMFMLLIMAICVITSFAQTKPKFITESVTILPGQESLLNVHVYNLPPMELYALTFIVKTDITVELFECTGIDEGRWPFIVENYSDSFYAGAWIRDKYYSTSQGSIQTYFNGEVFTQLRIKPIYNTNVTLEVELAGRDGKVIPIEVINGSINVGLPPPKPKTWACGDNIAIKDKQYGTMWLPVQKVCMLTENYNDGYSLKYKGIPTGQYLAKDWVTPEGFYLPTPAALKEANLPAIDKGYKLVNSTLTQNSNTYYLTSSVGMNNFKVLWSPVTPTKYITDSNYSTSCWVRLCIPYVK